MAGAVDDLRQYHWAFDGLIPETPKATLLRSLLERLVAETSLHPISPYFVSVRTPDYQAFVVIAESHISIQGKGPQCFVDMFSCKPFDELAVLRLLEDNLKGNWKLTHILRGEDILSLIPGVEDADQVAI